MSPDVSSCLVPEGLGFLLLKIVFRSSKNVFLNNMSIRITNSPCDEASKVKVSSNQCVIAVTSHCKKQKKNKKRSSVFFVLFSSTNIMNILKLRHIYMRSKMALFPEKDIKIKIV